MVSPPVFETRSRLLIHEGQEEGLFATAVEILQGNVLAEEVLSSLGAERIFPQMQPEQRLRQFQRQLWVEPVESSTIIHLVFRHGEAALALEVLEQVLLSFAHTLDRLHYSVKSLREGQLSTALHQMQRAENTLKVFKTQHGAQRFQARRVQLAQQRSRLEKQLVREEEKVKDFEKKRVALRQELQKGDQEMVEYRMELVRLKIYEKQLQQKYTEEQQTLGRVRQQIKRLQREPHNPKIEALIEDLVELQVASSHQEVQRDNVQRLLNQTLRQEQRLAAQTQVLEELELAYSQSQEQYKQALESPEVSSGSSFTILERPLLPPPARQWTKWLGMLCIGVLLSAVYVGIRECTEK